MSDLRMAIQKKFTNASEYAGKTCELTLSIQRDGTLTHVTPRTGDLALCNAAIKAIKSATLPTPPSDEVYNAFQNPIILFKPQ